MTTAEAYRLLEIGPDASDGDVQHAWRDLTKVWHPDRFAHDAGLQQKAQEKLKAINEAYETIRAGRAARGWRGDAGESAGADRRDTPEQASIRRSRGWGAACLAVAVFFLLRRPTLGGFIVATAFFVAAILFFSRAR